MLARLYRLVPGRIRELVSPFLSGFYLPAHYYTRLVDKTDQASSSPATRDEPAVVAYFGINEERARLWAKRILGDSTAYTPGSRAWIWSQESLLRREQPDCHVLLVETNPVTALILRLRRGSGFTMPMWVQFCLDISRPLAELKKASSKLREQIPRKIRKYSLTYEVSEDEAQLRSFFDTMHVPYISGRHGHTAFLPTWSEIYRVFNNSDLLIVKRTAQTPVETKQVAAGKHEESVERKAGQTAGERAGEAEGEKAVEKVSDKPEQGADEETGDESGEESGVKTGEKAGKIEAAGGKVDEISGGLLEYDGEVATLRYLGLKNNDEGYLHMGGMPALYYFAMLHAMDRGSRIFNMGGTNPFLSDGVAFFKLTFKPFVDRISYLNEFPVWLTVRKPSQFLERFFMANPFLVLRRDGNFDQVLLVDNRRDDYLEKLDSLLKKTRCEGVKEYLFAVRINTPGLQETLRQRIPGNATLRIVGWDAVLPGIV